MGRPGKDSVATDLAELPNKLWDTMLQNALEVPEDEAFIRDRFGEDHLGGSDGGA